MLKKSQDIFVNDDRFLVEAKGCSEVHVIQSILQVILKSSMVANIYLCQS